MIGAPLRAPSEHVVRCRAPCSLETNAGCPGRHARLSAWPTILESLSELRPSMSSDAAAGAGATAGGLEALVPRERRRDLSLDSGCRAPFWHGADRALLRRVGFVLALRWRRVGPGLTDSRTTSGALATHGSLTGRQ